MRRIYMDANATTPLAPEVFDAMRPWMLESYGNASSIHYYGQQARGAVERRACPSPRSSTAAPPRSSSPAEAPKATTSPSSASSPQPRRPLHHLVNRTSRRPPRRRMPSERGVEVTFLPVGSDCLVDPDDLRRALRPNTRLISIMMANNETGAIQPVEEIGNIAAEADVFFHTDAVQAAGKLPIDVAKIGCDLLAIAGHKMYAPAGSRSPLRPSRHPDRAALLRRNPRAPAPRRHRKRRRNRRPRQSRRTRRAGLEDSGIYGCPIQAVCWLQWGRAIPVEHRARSRRTRGSLSDIAR